MVRFIIITDNLINNSIPLIYIPIWLDLLFQNYFQFLHFLAHLHSNMVRFIIEYGIMVLGITEEFTFQYGQIYYVGITIQQTAGEVIYIPIWLDLLLTIHSLDTLITSPFTFQYGQIYYK